MVQHIIAFILKKKYCNRMSDITKGQKERTGVCFGEAFGPIEK